MTTTQTGIPITSCETCGRRHPITRPHCGTCGSPSLFPCARPGCERTTAIETKEHAS